MPLIFLLLFIAVSIVFQLSMPINTDVGWRIYTIEQMLAGVELYKDIPEQNMPMITWINYIPVWIADKLALPNIPPVITFYFLILFYGYFACAYITDRIGGFSDKLKTALKITLSYALFLLPIAMLQNNFGEKEHLFIALFLPYVFLSYGSLKGEIFSVRTRFITSLIAAIGICIKPFFVLPFIACELAIAAYRRNPLSVFRMESLVIGITGLLYLAMVLLFVPEYMEVSVPLSIGAYTNITSFSGLFTQLPYMIFHTFPFLIVVAFVPLVRQSKFAGLFMAVYAGMFLAAYLQFKGWNYHLYPAMAAGLLLLVKPLVCFIENIRIRGKKSLEYYAGLMVLMLSIPSLLFIGLFNLKENYGGKMAGYYSGIYLLRPYVEEYKDKGTIMIFGGIKDGFPLINYTGAEYGWRFSSMWLAGGIMEQYEEHGSLPDDWKWREEYFFDAMIEDLSAKSPALVIVNMGDGSEEDERLKFLMKDERFRKIWEGYTHLKRVGDDTTQNYYDLYVAG